jgi:hypothetical protein
MLVHGNTSQPSSGRRSTVTPLPQPQIVACYFDIGFTPPIAAMQLSWPDPAERAWSLPRGETIRGPLPRRFGLQVRRQAEDAYAVLLVWDSTYRQYFSLRRQEVEASSLDPLLTALGSRLADLLDQPIGPPEGPLPSAA